MRDHFLSYKNIYNFKEMFIMKRYLQNRNNAAYDLFDAFNDILPPVFFDDQYTLRTNIKETNEGYELEVEMPGYKKDEIKVSLDDGYLTVSAKKENREEDNGKHYLRKEITESCQRSYYVGTELSQEQITAKYDNGMLVLTIPKAQPKNTQSHFIEILLVPQTLDYGCQAVARDSYPHAHGQSCKIYNLLCTEMYVPVYRNSSHDIFPGVIVIHCNRNHLLTVTYTAKKQSHGKREQVSHHIFRFDFNAQIYAFI